MRLTGLRRPKDYELIASGDIEAVKEGRCSLVVAARLPPLPTFKASTGSFFGRPLPQPRQSAQSDSLGAVLPRCCPAVTRADECGGRRLALKPLENQGNSTKVDGRAGIQFLN